MKLVNKVSILALFIFIVGNARVFVQSDYKNVPENTKYYESFDTNIESANIADLLKRIIDIGKCGDNLTYTLTSDGLLTISGSGSMYGYANEEECPWRDNRDKIEKIVLEQGVTSIGTRAFSGCANITSVEMPDSVININDYAFCGCSGLTSIQIPSNVTSIGNGAFEACIGLTSIEIPSSVTYIGKGKFINLNSVKFNGGGAFNGCTGLSSIKVDDNNEVYDSRDNCNAIIEKSTNTLLVGCKNTIIPSNVTCIGDGAFEGCSELTSITIPNNVTQIKEMAFYGCSGLTSVTLSNGLTSISGRAFYGCNSLTCVVIPDSVTEIYDYAFCACDKLEYVYVLNENTELAKPSGILMFEGKSFSQATLVGFKGSTAEAYANEKDYNFEEITPKTTTIGTPVVAADGITVKWSNNTTADGYYIYRSVNGATYTKVKDITNNVTVSWKDTAANVNGNKYQYKIVAYKTINGKNYTGSASSIKTIYFLTRPTVTLANTSTGVKVSWGKNTNATGYYVYRSTDSGSTYKLIKTITSNATVSYTDTEAKTNGTKYMYKVVTYKTVSGTTYKSEVSAVKTVYFLTRPTITLANTSTGVKVSWGKNANATGYYVYRSTDSGSTYKLIKTITSNATVSYTDTEAKTNGTKYMYKVVTNKTVSGTTYKSEVSVVKTIYFLTRPTITLANTSTGVKVSWGKNTNATGYYVYRSTDSGSTYKLIKTITSNATVSYTDTEAKTNGTKYMYKVVTYKTVSGTTYKSEVSTVKTVYFLTRPTITLANTSTGVKVSWGKNTNATGYYVYRSTDSGSTYKLIKTITSNATVSYTDTEAKTNGTKYMYKVVTYKTVSGTTYKSAVSDIVTKYFVSKPAISSLTNSASATMIVKWARNTKATGYNIQYSTSSDFSSPKTVTATGTTTTLSKTIASLTNGKTYYVRIRSYMTVGSTTYYSVWSESKNVKVNETPIIDVYKVGNSDNEYYYSGSFKNSKCTVIAEKDRIRGWVKDISIIDNNNMVEKCMNIEEYVKSNISSVSFCFFSPTSVTVINDKIYLVGSVYYEDGSESNLIIEIKDQNSISVKKTNMQSLGGTPNLYLINKKYVLFPSYCCVDEEKDSDYDHEAYYYVSSDLIKWNKKTIQISSYSKNLINSGKYDINNRWGCYLGLKIEFLGETDGVIYYDEVIRSWNYVDTHHIMYTSDFTNYKEVKSINSYIKTNSNKRDTCRSQCTHDAESNHQDMTNIKLMHCVNNNSSIFVYDVGKYANHNNSRQHYKLVNMGILMSDGVDSFKSLLNYTDGWNNSIQTTKNDDEILNQWDLRGTFINATSIPDKALMFLETEGTKPNYLLQMDIKKGSVVKLTTQLQESKINDIKSDNGYIYILYENKYIYVSKDNCRTLTRVDIGKENISGMCIAGNNLVLILDKSCDYYVPLSKIKNSAVSTVSYNASHTYTGSAIKPAVTVKDSAGNTIAATNYTVSYTNNTAVGKATIKITFKGRYSGTITKTFNIVPKKTTIGTPAVASDGITVKWTKNTSGAGYYIYRSVNGGTYTKVKTITSNATVSWKDTTAKTNGNKYQYKIVAYKTVSGTTYKSAVSAIKTMYFVSKPAISSATNSVAGKMLVKWARNAKASGYQIQYSTSSSFTSPKSVTATGTASTLSKTIASLTKGKTYYVRIRSYKTVGSTKFYSAWSASKSVKITK